MLKDLKLWKLETKRNYFKKNFLKKKFFQKNQSKNSKRPESTIKESIKSRFQVPIWKICFFSPEKDHGFVFTCFFLRGDFIDSVVLEYR